MIMPLEMERQILTIMNHVDGVNDSPFHDPDNPIVITEYTFTSKRMGNVSLTATLMHDTCLDDAWDGTQYVTFNGEKYFISATPSSSKSSDDARYRHDLTFMAERDIKLNNIYFYDAVSEESTDDDKYKSNSTKVVFFGDIHEFVARLNESLAYSNVGYTAVVDEGITSEAKLMSFEDQFFFNVLQEIFNVYELPFYFVGTVIHIGFTANAITHPFKYGFDNELLSIKKNNANYRIVTRCTGTGSPDNIPYYYPNSSPKGDIAAKAGASNTGVLQEDITIKDMELFARSFDYVTPLLYEGPEVTDSECFNYIQDKYRRIDPSNIPYQPYEPGTDFSVEYDTDPSDRTRVVYMKFSGHTGGKGSIDLRVSWGYRWTGGQYYATFATEYPEEDIELSNCVLAGISGSIISLKFDSETDFSVSLKCYIRVNLGGWSGNSGNKAASFTVSYTPYWQKSGVWIYGDRPVTDIGSMGISIGDAEPENGDTIMQVQERFITPSDNLLPPIYRESDGAERFYNAINGTYTNPDTGEKYVFENEFVETAPKEHIVEFEDIKPTIKGAENAARQRMDQILDIAFDTDDNDDVDEEGKYLHPHFFVKLAKFDGEWGFNLFDQAIEDEEMTLAMTSGDCGACEFTIKVGEETRKNIVQVDPSGNLMRDGDGNVITSGEPQDRQNDTRNYEVWIALEKEESTYGQLMPNAQQGIRPKVGDTFVLLNIRMPDEYVYRAEDELKEAIIKYMAENNAEKFNFSIDFSRIYLAQNKDIALQLNENARIQLEYNGKLSEFYISQYTYKCVDGEALPEVTVELTDTVTVTKTTLQNSIDAVQQDIQNGIGGIDFLKQGLRYFLRKDVDDESRGTPKFLAGAEFGRFSSGTLGSGAAVRIDSNNASHMEVDYLSVRRRADFTTISVQELKQIGGQLIISPAAMVCSSVEETEDAYRCHFDTDEDNGRQSIYNQFVEGDQARMQTFNQLGSRYFWRLVTAVGDDWIDLSKTDCEEGSDIPQEGDNIVQLGNRNDTARQSAQVFSCFGENAPSFIMYNGINSYDLTGKNITGIVYNPETGEPQMYSYGAMFFGDRDIEAEDANYITYQQKEGDTKKKLYISADIKIGAGSSGLSNLEEWAAVQEKIDKAIAGTDVEYYSSTSPTALVGGSWSTTAPTWEKGRYIWTRTKITYADGTTSTTDPVCITGNDGEAGGGGKEVRSITERYYLSESPTELVGGSWSTEAPTWSAGSYIWTKSVIEYSDGTSTETEPICVTGPAGPAGSDGTDGSSVLAQYSSDGTSWHSAYQEGDMWMRTSSDNGASWTPAIRIVGQDGQDGEPGAPGSPGRGVQSVTEYYLVSDRSTGISAGDPGWSTAIPTMTPTHKFLWNKETVRYTDSSETTTTPVVIGVYGDEGSAGKGISSITEYYLASESDSGVTTETAGWTTAVQKTDSVKRYLWNYERIQYTDGSHTDTEPAIIGTQGEQGIPGVPGDPGADGKTYYTWIRYADNAQGGGISDDPTGKSYIGFAYNRETATESDSPSDYKWSDIKGEQGVPGEPGADGTTLYTWIAYSDNEDGSDLYQQPKDTTMYIGIATNRPTPEEDSDPRYYTWSRFKGDTGAAGADGSYVVVQFAKNTSITDAPTSGWQDTPPSAQAGEYVWMRTGTVQPPADSPSSWNAAVRLTGDTGSDGESVYMLDLSNEVATVSCDSEGNVTSGMPECTATVYRGGDKAAGYSFSAEFNGCAGSIDAATGVVAMTAITADTAQVIVAASSAAGPELTSTMTITKVYPGAQGNPGQPGTPGDPGQPAVMKYLLPSADKITRGFSGTAEPQELTCLVMMQTGDGTPEEDSSGTAVIHYQRTGEDESMQEYSGPVQVTDNTTAVIFTLLEGETVIDRERVPVLNDASDMETGGVNLLKDTAFNDLSGFRSLDGSANLYRSYNDSAFDHNGNHSAAVMATPLDTTAGIHTITDAAIYYTRCKDGENPTNISSWSPNRSSLTSSYSRLFLKITVTYSDGTTGDSRPQLVGRYMESNPVSSVTVRYLASGDQTADPSSGAWVTSLPEVSENAPYLHAYADTEYADGLTEATEAFHAGCYNRTGLDLLLWPDSFMTGKPLMLSFYFRGNTDVHAAVIGAETDLLAEHGGWIDEDGFSLTRFTRATIYLGRVTSIATDVIPCVRLRFGSEGTFYLNSPMLEYGNVVSEWSPAPQDTRREISDLEYLKEIFGAPTVDSEGAILAKLLAVKDESGNVVAGLNASEEGMDSEHGKLLLFTGSTGIQEIDSASTRIYEDGTLITNKIIATGGKIGGFELTYDEEGRIACFTVAQTFDSAGTNMKMTNTSLLYDAGLSGKILMDVTPSAMTKRYLLDIQAVNISKMDNINGIHLSIESNDGLKPAILCERGCFRGLRPSVKFVSETTYYISKEDFFLCCYLTSTQNLYLPSNPENGQTYFLMKASENTIYVRSQGKEILSIPGNTNETVSTLVSGAHQTYLFTYNSQDNKWWLDSLK